MSRRDQIRMTDEEMSAFLAEPRTMAVATNGRDGFPHVVAMWYTLMDGKVAFWTYAKSQKAVNLRRDPRVSCLVEDGDEYGQLRGVLIKGTAELIEDTETVLRLGENLREHYAGPLDDEARRSVAAQAPKRIAVLVHQREVTSWDHRKLQGLR